MKLIRNGTVWAADGDAGPAFQQGWDVFIAGSRIERAGPGLADEPEARGAEVIDASGCLVIPGFVNAHTHAAMTLLRSYADDMPLQEWLTQKIWPVEARLEPDDIYWGTLLAIVEMVRAGVTAFGDMYFSMDRVARAVEESGVRAALAPGLFDGEGWEAAFRESRRFAERHHGSAGGRIRAMFGPHSTYAAGKGLPEVARAAREMGIAVHIHLSETKREVEESLAGHGGTPIQVAERSGLLEGEVVAAHCVHLSDADIELLARRGVRVVHNPTSNMKLGSGRAPVQRLIDAGVTVALGTDGAASNNNLDMLEEARLAAFLAKLEGEPDALPAHAALEMATERGARALGFGDVGRIAPGWQADLVLIRADGPHWAPPHDLCANLIYSGQSADVETVLVAGEIIMERKAFRTLDVDRIIQEARRRGLDLVRRT